MYVNAAILGGIIGNRSDAGFVATLRWLSRRRRGTAALTEEQLMQMAIEIATRRGYRRRRLRCLDVSADRASRPVVLLRVNWSKTVLVVRVDTANPDKSEIDPVKLFPPR
jgi:hypothetical protein